MTTTSTNNILTSTALQTEPERGREPEIERRAPASRPRTAGEEVADLLATALWRLRTQATYLSTQRGV
jgi:hypothetical protein